MSEKAEERLPSLSNSSGVSRCRHSKTRSTSRNEASPTGISSAGRGGVGGGNGGGGDDGGSGGGGRGGSFGRSTPGEGRGVNDSSYDGFARSLRNICPRTLDGDGTRVDPTSHPAACGKVGDRLLFIAVYYRSDGGWKAFFVEGIGGM